MGLKQPTLSVSQNPSNSQYLWSLQQDQNFVYNYKLQAEPPKYSFSYLKDKRQDSTNASNNKSVQGGKKVVSNKIKACNLNEHKQKI